jgi:hypothetical protein
MGWPVKSTTDEARVKWNTAMKFLIPAKFDVNRAVDLYTTHQVRNNYIFSKKNIFNFRIFEKLKISIIFG